MIVVDASVAVKWFVPEPGEEAAKQLLVERHRLIAPSLIRIEVTGALLRSFRENRLPEKGARAAIAAWDRMLEDAIVHLVPDEELYAPAVAIGFKSRHAIQDCLYLAVAQDTKAKVITADRPMFERGGKSGGNIVLLEGV